jgi:hypothetical protein
MKRIFAHAALAAAGFCISASVQATPVYFDFTGTLDSNGRTISGGFNFETDRLLSAGPPSGGTQYSFVDTNPFDFTRPSAFVSFEDQRISFPLYTHNANAIAFTEGCAVAQCPQFTSDWFALQAHTSEFDFAGHTGTMRGNSLQVFNFSETAAPDFFGFDAFDAALATPVDIVNLPLHNAFGIYQEAVYDCIAGNCSIIGVDQYSFSLDTVSRGIGARDVPEPGTLGLFAAGLLCVFALRRRPVLRSLRTS